MRRMREDHLHRNYSDVNERPIRCRAKLIQPKAGMAARLAMIPSAYNGTFCPATAASNGGSSERSSEGLDSRWALPGAGCILSSKNPWFCQSEFLGIATGIPW